jgi:pimeloyl-ACP methyl ester carboxylesterase
MLKAANVLLRRTPAAALDRFPSVYRNIVSQPRSDNFTTASAPTRAPRAEALFHLSLNDHQPTTILLLHGLLSSHREWTYVTPGLSSYHLLVPDLPAHSSSADITPFTIAHAASLVASLLDSHARSTPCHVVGLSAGGFVALGLAKARPELVQSLFVTGVGGAAARRWLMAAAPYVVTAAVTLQSVLPDALNDFMVRKMEMKIPDGLQREIYSNLKFAMVKQAYASIADYGGGEPLPMRTLAVAGGRQDDVEGTRRLGHVLRTGCAESRAAVVHGAVHAWDLQWPELFARGVEAWVEGRELPGEFRELS